MELLKDIMFKLLIILVMIVIISPFLMTILLKVFDEKYVDIIFMIIQALITLISLLVLRKLDKRGDFDE